MKRILKYFFSSILSLVLVLVIAYFFKPSFVENTAIKFLYPKVTVENKYIDKYVIEIPKMNELMYIACSLTETFRKDSNLISRQVPEYLQDVNETFSPLKNHPLVQVLENKLKGNAYSQIQPTIRFFSLNYEIDEDNTIINNEIFHVNSILLKLFKGKIFYYPEHLELIEDFAKKSNFNDFYKTHTPYYNSLIQKFDKLCDIKGSWEFLEERFQERYRSYRIIFSPLTGGFHNTLPGLKDKKTKMQQAWLFVSAPPNIQPDSLSIDELEIKRSQFTREMFTEMDHNYVNPLTDTFINTLDESIPNYKIWNKRERGYSSNYATFNEYMTWGIFTLYAEQSYSEKNLDTILSMHENFMIKRRKFTHFKAFNSQLIKLSKAEKITPTYFKNIYPEMLLWMKSYD